MYVRPISGIAPELYQLEPSQRIADEALTEVQTDWGFRIGHLVDQGGNDLPPVGNTAFIRIHARGMTAPAQVVQPQHNASARVSVLAGKGALVRAFPSGGTELSSLESDTEFTLRAGQTYACVNTGEDDMVLRREGSPAFGPEDEVQLVKPYAKASPAELTASTLITGRDRSGEVTGLITIQRSIAPPDRFYALIDQVAGGRSVAWI